MHGNNGSGVSWRTPDVPRSVRQQGVLPESRRAGCLPLEIDQPTSRFTDVPIGSSGPIDTTKRGSAAHGRHGAISEPAAVRIRAEWWGHGEQRRDSGREMGWRGGGEGS